MATTERARQGRERRQPRNAQEAKDRNYYYRQEYGWMMSDDDVAEEKRIKSEVYDAGVETVRGQIADAESKYETARADGIADIERKYSDAFAKIGSDATKVRVVSGGNNIEATYTVPKSYANEYASNQQLFTSWHGNFLNVGVRARGGRTVGQELHDALRDAQGQYSKALNTQRDNLREELAASKKTFNDNTDANLAGEREVWNAQLAEAENAYSNRVKTGAESYQKSRKAYNDSIMNMNLGLLETPTNQVNTGGNNG